MPQRPKKAEIENKKEVAAAESAVPKAESEKPAQPAESAQLEKSLAVLSRLKELEFHSRANIEKLAELSLTIEEELKQKAFAEAIGKQKRRMQELGVMDALAMGFAQCLALIPGSSRSGSTIMAGLFAGETRETAARFSFLLSMPAVAASGLLELKEKCWDCVTLADF